MSPKVSVLMGAYNCASTLEESVRSVLVQDLGDFELIVCEDGSSDGTPAILDRLAAEDGRIKVLRNGTNRGLAHSLNRCLEAAKAPFLARMDGDDLCVPGRFSRQVALLESRPELALCGSSIRLFDEEGEWGAIDYPGEPGARDFLVKSPYAHPTVMFRAEALRAMGGYSEDPGVGRSEDYELFFRMTARGLRGANLADYLLLYREDRRAYRKRKFRFALIEARVRYRGFRSLGLLPGALPWAAKPIIVGFLPKSLYRAARRGAFGGKRP